MITILAHPLRLLISGAISKLPFQGDYSVDKCDYTGLRFPASFSEASPELREKVCNGCGSAQSNKDYIPDNVIGLNINAAAHIHDWGYEYGKDTYEDKCKHDRIFMNNMLRIIDAKGGILRNDRRKMAKVYYDAVVLCGGPSYWVNKNND